MAKTEKKKVADLVPAPYNPRIISEKQLSMLRKSMLEFGDLSGIVKNIKTGHLVGGHQRIKNLDPSWPIVSEPHADKTGTVALGYIETPSGRWQYREVDWPEKKEAAANIAANQHGGEFDMPALKEIILTLDDGSMDMELTGFNSHELELMMTAEFQGEEGTADAEPQIDRAEELNKTWGVKPGDLWQIGDHRLLCGDSTLAADVQKVMGGEKADIVVADPPYGISIVAANGYVGGGEAYNIPFGGRKKGDVGGTAAHMRKTGRSYLQEWNEKKRLGTIGGAKPFGSKKVRGSDGAANIVDVGKYAPIIGDDTTETAIRAAHLHLELFPDAKQFWFGANHYANALPPSSCWVVWDKETTGNFSDCELAWCNQDKAARLFRHKWNGMLRDSERERRMHPSQKPAALAAWIYTEFGKESDIVLDQFAGAGWTMVAAENTKRAARVIEMSPEYGAIILQRMTDAFPGIEIRRMEP